MREHLYRNVRTYKHQQATTFCQSSTDSTLNHYLGENSMLYKTDCHVSSLGAIWDGGSSLEPSQRRLLLMRIPIPTFQIGQRRSGGD